MTSTPQPLPADDPQRTLAVARPGGDHDGLAHVAIGGGAYTILLSGEDTNGRFTVIDMQVPAGGGPPPHRHDFEEAFTVLEGEIVATFRGETTVLGEGDTINVPANAPHSFRNASDRPARLLCTCSPAGQERYFLEVGDRLSSRTAPLPQLDDAARAARGAKAQGLALQYRSEFV